MTGIQGAPLSYAIGLAFLVLLALITGGGLFMAWLKKGQNHLPAQSEASTNVKNRPPQSEKKAA